LEAQLKDARAYAKEADELNEQKAATIDELRKTVEEKDRVIAGLQSQIAELNKRIAKNEKNIQDLTGELDVAIANYDYVCGLPWYQRMFFKGK
jgi:predicted  nucleic acid-binding Zn-ribbon protein